MVKAKSINSSTRLQVQYKSKMGIFGNIVGAAAAPVQHVMGYGKSEKRDYLGDEKLTFEHQKGMTCCRTNYKVSGA